ncbi:MAG TPA: hypothetical protein DEA43_00125 [Candidatus Moranbacteria bacterium]|nr:hypothetical protein [Candidatus Moranbacteria bacterium]HBT45277.1 hypothetical protein [Candidatus Moranbacteria bacterium]
MGAIITKDNQVSSFQLYMAARAIADLVYEYASPEVSGVDGIWLEDRRAEGVNPYCSQTSSGLFLELYYGQPGSIHTPWGKWNCWGSGCGSWEEKIPELLKRLDATVYKELVRNSQGEFGPIYALHRIGNLILPDSVAKTRNEELSYETAKAEWKRLTRDFHEFHGKQSPTEGCNKFALDNIILEARGHQESKPNGADIYNIAGLEQFRGKIVKYTRDSGKTWRYAQVWDTPVQRFDFSNGYCTYEEVMPNAQVHCRASFRDVDFQRGLVVRSTTDEEIQGIQFSYGK